MRIILSSLFILLLLFSCKQQEMPLPWDGKTIVKNADEGEKHDLKKEWLKMLFRTPDGLSAEQIENETSYRRFLKRNHASTSRDPIEEIANGKLKGTWAERGSRNQSGSVFKTAYDTTTQNVYVISDGLHLWRGKVDGSSWELLNHKTRFQRRFLALTKVDSTINRILVSINNQPHYSEDEGQTWTPSEAPSEMIQIKDQLMLDDSTNHVFFLATPKNSSTVGLYQSKDKGLTYQQIKVFGGNDINKFSMSYTKKSNQLFILDNSSSVSHLYSWDAATNDVAIISQAMPINASGNPYLRVTEDDNLTYLYFFDGSKIHLSTDLGKNWDVQGVLPTKPWSVGFYASAEEPNVLLYGEVECYKSIDGGKSWAKLNGWAEYYGDVVNKLHADMMAFDDFYDPKTNKYFTLISNHGGLSIMRDFQKDPINIGLDGLNVSQYYSVRTHPNDESFVYAGSQDQGFQRGLLKEEGILKLDQVISGDYGHIQFTHDKHLWTVYPFGWVSYYENPKNGGITHSYQIDKGKKSVWIPPLAAVEDGSSNIIYAAGGSVTGSGSHILKLVANENKIDAYQIEFDFFKKTGAAVSAIAVKNDEETIYAATTNGRFFYSHDFGDTFTESNTVPGGHYLYGQAIIPSKLNDQVIYTGGTGYNGVPAMRSIDGGASFENFSEGLPPCVILGMALNKEENLLFAATTAGPYVCIMPEEKWYDMSGEAAPDVTFWSVEIVNDDNIARFGTYGRGIYDFNIDYYLHTNTDETKSSAVQVQIYPNPASQVLNIKWPDGKIADAAIYDAQGKMVKQINANNKMDQINIEALPNGNYFLRFNHASTIISKQFSKQ